MKPPHDGKRETVELIDGSVYFSDDHWRTVHKMGGSRVITGRAADRVRYIALVQHGGGRDD